jgi:predicted ATPase
MASNPAGNGDGEAGYSPHLAEGRANQFVVLSGCSGGGKSSLLAELGRRGHPVFEEAGRQIIKEQHYIGGNAVPSGDVMQFVELMISREIYNLISAARRNRLAFFDRGIVDQISGLERRNLPIPGHLATAAERFRYCETVFMVPPWLEMFSNDSERRHSFADALADYETLLRTYERLGYRTVIVPKLPVAARADFVIDSLAQSI